MRKTMPGRGLTLVLLAAVSFAALCAGKAAAREFYHDFRSQSLHPALQVYGADAGRAVRAESGGMRITLPAERETQGVVGVSPVFLVSGNFEITLGYDILKADPGLAQGVGLNLRIMVGSPMRKAADMARYHRAEEGEVFMANIATPVEGEQPQRDLHFFPARANAGKLRLQRNGSTLHFLVAEGSADTFQEIYQADFLPDDCQVRMAAVTGKGLALEARLLDVRIQADDLPGAPVEEPPKSHFLAWLVCVLLLGAAAAGGFFYWRRQAANGSGPPASRPAAPAKAATTASRVPKA